MNTLFRAKNKFSLLTTSLVLVTSVLLTACNETKAEKEVHLAPEESLRSPASTSVATSSLENIVSILSEKLKPAEKKPDDIWPRIRSGFQLPDDIKHKALETELKWFAKHPEYIRRVTKRAEPFLHYITEEAEKRNLPTELVLLPIVESAFQPFAYSHGRAAGIWQFIPSTGRAFGLKQNWWYDGRRDIHASTQAALNYLEKLNKQFKGDWMLALASYNSGSGTVNRAIRKNKRLKKPTDFWHLKLPKETQAYVPKLLALKEIVSNPEKYSTTLHKIKNAPGFKQVKVTNQIDLALAAELADVDLKTLYNYNPAFNRWATDPDGPHSLILPIESAQTFEKNYKELPADKHLRWSRHKIKSGETLSHIAVKYNTSVKHLKKVNNISDTGIREGKYLIIPLSSKDKSNYALSSSQRLKSIQSKKRGGGNTRVNHIVQNGESFWEIARKYKVGMHKLAKWNGMAIKDPLRKGQKLVVWTKGKNKSAKSANPHNTVKSIHYTVRSGDSLSRIASRYHVSVTDLHRWNKIKGKYLKPGQRLKLYIDVTEQSG